MDIVIEQNSECFSDIDFVRDRISKYYQSNCESKKGKQRKYYAENSDNICKMKKAYYKKIMIRLFEKGAATTMKTLI